MTYESMSCDEAVLVAPGDEVKLLVQRYRSGPLSHYPLYLEFDRVVGPTDAVKRWIRRHGEVVSGQASEMLVEAGGQIHRVVGLVLDRMGYVLRGEGMAVAELFGGPAISMSRIH